MTDPFTPETAARISESLNEPDWLRARRMEAVERFASLPWPDTSAEEWRHTDLRDLDAGRFDFEPTLHPEVASLDQLDGEIRRIATEQSRDRAGVAVRMDSNIVSIALDESVRAAGVLMGPLHLMARSHPDIVERWLGTAGVPEYGAKLHALTAGFGASGSFIYVPPGVHLEMPLETVRTFATPGVAVLPRITVIADEAASVTYIDHFGAGELGGESLVVPWVEIYAAQSATVNYLMVQDLPQTVWHLAHVRALIGRDATVRTLVATLGGKLARTMTEGVLDGQGSHAEMLGLYFGDHAQHIDNRTLQLHRGPNTSSEVYYKGALKGSSRAIYSGLVDIEKDAKQSDAQQANRNLLLSKEASADPSPFLEIKTSEVARATHGVSVGRPDEETLFYLRSRGLDHADAERLYVTGFFQEVIDRVRVPAIRETLERAVVEELELES